MPRVYSRHSVWAPDNVHAPFETPAILGSVLPRVHANVDDADAGAAEVAATPSAAGAAVELVVVVERKPNLLFFQE